MQNHLWLIVGLCLLAIGAVASSKFLFLKKNRSSTIESLPIKDVVSPEGLVVVASAGPPRNPLPESHANIIALEKSAATRRYACGHVGPKSFKLDVYGESTKVIDQKRDCPECMINVWRKHVIRCALCGHSIMPGEGVALYSGVSKNADLTHSTHVGDSVIGCLRWDCCPSGGFFAGHWTEEGFAPLYAQNETAAESLMHES